MPVDTVDNSIAPAPRVGVYYNRTNMEVRNIQRVMKVGDSLAVTIPKHLTKSLGIQRGDGVMVACTDPRAIVIVRLSEEELRRRRLGLISDLNYVE